jgi:uracil-DNA glycosylase
MVDSVEQFVADLARERTPSLVNQYAGDVDGVDQPGGASIRRANLVVYLLPRVGATLALIGEAPSAHGARFSGIAFTAERSLAPDQRTSARSLTSDGFTELSATVLERALHAAGLGDTNVVLWNAVPFHPASAADPLKNRSPRVGERALGALWLARFLDLMKPREIVAVGQTARAALPVGSTVVRHPAHGGSRQLQADLIALAAHPAFEAR